MEWYRHQLCLISIVQCVPCALDFLLSPLGGPVMYCCDCRKAYACSTPIQTRYIALHCSLPYFLSLNNPDLPFLPLIPHFHTSSSTADTVNTLTNTFSPLENNRATCSKASVSFLLALVVFAQQTSLSLSLHSPPPQEPYLALSFSCLSISHFSLFPSFLPLNLIHSLTLPHPSLNRHNIVVIK